MASSLCTTIRRKREKISSLELTSSSLSVDHYRSKVWNYYTKLGDANVECKFCRKQLSFHNGTTNMREHLTQRHSIRNIGGSQTKEQSDLDYHEQEGVVKKIRQAVPINSLCPSESRPQVIGNLILEMLYRDLHPLSVVEDKGFGLLLGYLEPNVDLPTSTQLADILWHKYTAVKQQLKCCLQSAPSIVLSIESWNDQSKSYLSITANVIDNDWRLCRYLLETQHVIQNQADDNLTERLHSVLTEFGLSSNLVTCVVHDRWTSLTSHAQSFKDSYEWASLCCTSHVLQLCVQAGLEVQEVKEALSAAREFVSFFQEDFKASCFLNSKLEAMNKPRLVVDTERYWISTLEMCQNLLDLKWAILSILEEQGVKNLSEQHWKLLQDLVHMLKTIWIATAFLQEEQNASISSLMPCVHGIFMTFKQTSEDSSSIKAAACQIRSEICRYWGMQDEEKLTTDPITIASFLDPRFKELRFLKPSARGEVHTIVRNMLSLVCKPCSTHCLWMPSTCAIEGGLETVQLPVQKDKELIDGPENVYDLLLGKDPTECMPEAHQQLENYIVEPVCKRTTDPLAWWNTNSHRFPTLARLARQYLVIPATAVKPEHAFGTIPDPLETRRAALESKYMDQILFLHQNKDLVDCSMKPNI